MSIAPPFPRFEYIPRYKPNQILCGYGQTAVITGWTVKQAIAKHLEKEEYAAIGNLYSATRGLGPLLRNLIANPHVRFIVILNATKEDKNGRSSECLLDFFREGFAPGKSETGRDCWLVRSAVPGYIDKEIDGEILEKLRESLEYREARTLEEAIAAVRSYYRRQPLEPWGEALTFPLEETPPSLLPGTRYGHRIEGKTIAETWVKILHRIKTTGTVRPTGYDGRWQELIDLMAVVTDEPVEFYFPRPNYLPIDRSFLEGYISQILDDSPVEEGVKYTYGQRLRSWFGRDQIEQVIDKLSGEIDAASAVMSLWDVRDHERGGSPCLNQIWVRVVEDELSLTAVLRSNDMFAAWPANAMGLRALQEHVRERVARRAGRVLETGPLITLSQSAHLYDDTWENVDKLIADRYEKMIGSRDYHDPSGNFAIELENGQIVVHQTTPGSGEIVARYTGKNPLKLIREIGSASPAIYPEHIGYLGIELQKARDCLDGDRPYFQDR